MTTARQIGIAGLGLLGGALAHRLIQAGYSPRGFDIDAAKVAAFAKAGGVAAKLDDVAHCDVVLLAVFDTSQVEDVVTNAVLPALTPGVPKIVLCASTCDPDRIAALSDKVAARGLTLIETPVSGSSAQVRNGDGVGLLGGSKDAIDGAADIIDALYPKWFYMGPAGHGGRAKLAINHMLGLNRLVLAEGLVFAQTLGLDPAALLEVARQSAAYSQVMDIKGPKMVSGDYTPQGFIHQSLKDFRLIIEQAGKHGQEMPLASLNADVLAACVSRGESERDNAAVIEEIRRRKKATDLILRSIAQRCVSKDGGTLGVLGHASRRRFRASSARGSEFCLDSPSSEMMLIPKVPTLCGLGGDRDGMRRSEKRILTTHTGSLPRPLELTRLYARRARGEEVDAAELQDAGRAAMNAIVAKQAECQVDIGNNGEQQRDSFIFYIRDRLTGLGGSWQRRQRADVERYPVFMKESYEASLKKESVDDIRGLPKAIGAIGYPDASEVKAECSDFRHALDAAGNPFVEPFLTAPSPGMVSAIVKNEHYPSEEAFLAALGSALRNEYKAIVDAGFLLQLDCPDLAREKHNTFADRPLADFIAFGNRVIDAINAAIHDIPPERARLHVCWGNYEGPHDLDVELREIIPFLRRARVGGFVLPFANPRHAHEYRYLKDLLGNDQIIVAGVIDSTTNFVEHPEVIAERLENVAKTIGDPQRVMAGSDCGFETIAGRGRVAEDVVWAKFKSMAEGAKLASSRLF